MLLRSAIPLLISAAAVSGCITCEGDTEAAPAHQLQHRWTWQSSVGGIAGRTETPANTGQQRAIEFDANGNAHFYTNGQLTRTTTYTIQTGTSIRTSQPTDIIVYASGGRQSYSINGQQLTLMDEVYDGYVAEYQR
ncbi:hypothetical protein EJV47_25935 [Hymenobacter gummosus]|uniref:Lipocalin-like domain-containing protein n=1 Tax=Hymenobacter gummosus TaxID=1776032 RepID=A0A3S0J5V4_9BACT|nr:hypothetical protein [Hymenobacter gummosus]RTQ45315.1 hypothetical protein EJV47_25935 [Hymenobacter gummosus]